jgi:hypothetical protein
MVLARRDLAPPSIALPVRHARRADRLRTGVGRSLDLLLRTGMRRMFAAEPPPFLGSPAELDEGLANLALYRRPEHFDDPDTWSRPARPVHAWRVARERPVRGGRRVHYVFRSPYAPLHPDFALPWRAYDRLDQVHVDAWLHDEPPTASLIITHGWGAGEPWMHRREFGFDELFAALGVDIWFYVAPYHGPRTPTGFASGVLHPSPDLMRTNEAFAQTMQELRAVVDRVQARRPEAPIGVMGSSLGGYTSALLASVEPRLRFAVPVMPPSCMASLFWSHAGSHPQRKVAEDRGFNLERFREAWALHSPLNHRPLVPWDGRLVVTAAGDLIVTPDHVDRLWQHWGRPHHHAFAGGHLLQIGRRTYWAQLAQLLRRIGARVPPDAELRVLRARRARAR